MCILLLAYVADSEARTNRVSAIETNHINDSKLRLVDATVHGETIGVSVAIMSLKSLAQHDIIHSPRYILTYIVCQMLSWRTKNRSHFISI